MALSDRDRAILEFERSWWKSPGPKRSEIRRRFGLSASRYYELLADLALSDDAMEHDPLVVKRLRRSRDHRRRERFEGSYGRGRPSP
jgi:hypothetical protein